MIKLNVIFILICCMSCSTINFKSSQKIPVTFEKNLEHTQDVSLEVEKHIFMWGLYPAQQSVEVDKVFTRKGYASVSDLTIDEIKSDRKVLWALVTLGMYFPKTYKLIAKAN